MASQQCEEEALPNVKNMNIKIQETVFGFVRESQLLLIDNSLCKIIPELISYIVLSYYYKLTKPLIPIDEYFPYQVFEEGWEILDENGVIYDTMLRMSDGRNNKFYTLQVLTKDDDVNEYICYFRWGRVGYRGQTRWDRGQTKQECIATFKKKFWDKTLNNWDDRDHFEPHDERYTYFEKDYYENEKMET